ncbi:MAG: RDD family protein [Methanobacteriota archaeon]|nr:MAG: RDD family protein [Euryarchaeota archaeon]
MPTGFDYLGSDKALQQHWVKRLLAIVIDAVLIYAPIVVFISVLGGRYISAGLLSGVALFLYSSLFDLSVGGTIGKLILRMKSVAMTGRLSLSQAFMRNVTKVFAPLLLIDWIVGMAVETKDPRQKWTDQVAHTSVIVHDHPGGV